MSLDYKKTIDAELFTGFDQMDRRYKKVEKEASSLREVKSPGAYENRVTNAQKFMNTAKILAPAIAVAYDNGDVDSERINHILNSTKRFSDKLISAFGVDDASKHTGIQLKISVIMANMVNSIIKSGEVLNIERIEELLGQAYKINIKGLCAKETYADISDEISFMCTLSNCSVQISEAVFNKKELLDSEAQQLTQRFQDKLIAQMLSCTKNLQTGREKLRTKMFLEQNVLNNLTTLLVSSIERVEMNDDWFDQVVHGFSFQSETLVEMIIGGLNQSEVMGQN